MQHNLIQTDCFDLYLFIYLGFMVLDHLCYALQNLLKLLTSLTSYFKNHRYFIILHFNLSDCPALVWLWP